MSSSIPLGMLFLAEFQILRPTYRRQSTRLPAFDSLLLALALKSASHFSIFEGDGTSRSSNHRPTSLFLWPRTTALLCRVPTVFLRLPISHSDSATCYNHAQ